MSKEGYQPLKTKKTIKIIPPNTGSNIQMKKDGYTWEDLDKAWWEGFDNAKNKMEKRIAELEKENAELRKVAEFQQSSNMNRHFENKKLKEGLAVGSTFNKALNSINKTLEEERDKYRNMVFDKDEQLTKAKEIIKKIEKIFYSGEIAIRRLASIAVILDEAEQFLSEVEE